MASSLLNAPRALKDPVCWRFSSLRKGPIGEGSSGVSRIQERMRRSAREIASGSPAAAVIVAGREGCRTLAVASRGAVGRSGRRCGSGGPPFPPEPPQLAEGYDASCLLVPGLEGERGEARPEREGSHVLEGRVLPVAALQLVVRDPGAQVVHVVEADVPGKPLQPPGQPEVGAPHARRGSVVPLRPAPPVGVLELMLHVEQEQDRKSVV